MNDMILKNWHTLNSLLTQLREDQVKELLDYEFDHQRRKMMLLRLHQRYSTLRNLRERKELFGEDNVDETASSDLVQDRNDECVPGLPA